MATTNYIINAIVSTIQVYAPEERSLRELRDNRGAYNIGEEATDIMNYADLKQFRITASQWCNGQIRTFVHKENIPIGFPVPQEIEDASIAYLLFLVRDRVTASNRAEEDDIAVKLENQAKELIDTFKNNLDTYPDIIGANGKQITSGPTICTEDKILFGLYGIEDVEGGVSIDGHEDEPELKDGFGFLNETQP